MSVYVDGEQRRRISDLAARRGLSETAVFEMAIAALLASEGAEPLEAATRASDLKRLRSDLRRLEGQVKVTAEALGLFVRFWLETAGPASPTTLSSGKGRYRAFVRSLARRLSGLHSFFDDIREARERQQEALAGEPAATDASSPE